MENSPRDAYFLLFFEQPDGIHFVESHKLSYWLNYFDKENFVGGICCKKLDLCHDIIELLLNFLEPFIVNTKKCRKIEGDPERLKKFIRTKLGSVTTFYNGNGPSHWKLRAKKNAVKNDIT